MAKIKLYDYMILYFVDINSAYIIQNEEIDFVAYNQLFDKLFMKEILPDVGVHWQVFLYNYNGHVLNVYIGKNELTPELIQYYRDLYKNEYKGLTILN